MSRVTIMARLKFIGLFTVSHGGNRNQQGGCVPFMWPAALCSGLADFHVAGRNFEEILQHLKKKKKTLERFCSSLNVMVGYLCVQSLPEWA